MTYKLTPEQWIELSNLIHGNCHKVGNRWQAMSSIITSMHSSGDSYLMDKSAELFNDIKRKTETPFSILNAFVFQFEQGKKLGELGIEFDSIPGIIESLCTPIIHFINETLNEALNDFKEVKLLEE